MTDTSADLQTADIDRIQRLIPHRYPFLLVDRVEEIDGAERCVGIKNVTMNEPYFPGHFPSEPVMPGVLIIEAMAQTSAVMVSLAQNLEGTGALVYFMGVDTAKFRRKVVPGDRIEMEILKKRGGGKVWKFEGYARVNGELACEAVFTAMIAIPEG